MRRIAIGTFALLTSSSAGCTGDAANGGFAVRDSAGITIVENAVPAWTAETAWRLESSPSLTIGTVEGAPEYQMFQVRDALRLADGTIVVADGGSREIRFYDPAGTHVRSVGGEGEGPGEYRIPGLLARYRTDSLIVWDGNLDRGTVLALDGTLARTFDGHGIGTPFYYVYDVFGDGALLGRMDQGVDPDTLDLGLQRFNATYFRMDPTGRVDTIGVLFGNEELVYVSDRGTAMTGMGFGRRAVHATTGDLLHYGSSDTWEIRTYTSGGEPRRITRRLDGNVPVTQALIDAHKEASLARYTNPATLRSMEARFAATPWPETLPAYSDLKVDAQGNLWVADYLAPGEEQPRWTVFDAEGRMLGTIKTPIGFTIHDIGSDYLLGVERGELDVEQVVLYRLTRP
jgi:hypothetical protein